MAEIKKLRTGKGTKGVAQAIDTPATQTANLERPESGATDTLNFRVSPEFKREFKAFAAGHGITMRTLLEEGFQLVRERRGG